MNMEKKDVNLKLIEAVKRHECLYNTQCPQYKEFIYKERLWTKIGKQTGKTILETKKKWKNLRDNYKRYKQMSIHENGFRKPYKYADALRFLDDFPAGRYFKTITSASADAEVSTDLSSDEEFQYEPLAKLTKHSIEDSLEDVEEFLELSSNESSKTESLNLDNTNKLTGTIEENADTNLQKNNDDIDGTLSSEEHIKEKDLVERLIDEIKKYECIYNLKSTEYKNYSHKKHLWHKIGKRVGLTGNAANRKWKNLRDSYRRCKLKAIGESGFVKQYKYAESLRFLDSFPAYRPCTKSLNRTFQEPEISTDLSSDCDLRQSSPTNQELSTSSFPTEVVASSTITSRLFQLLVNKINEANLTPQEKNDIEYAVSAVVYSKLAEYNKNKTRRF